MAVQNWKKLGLIYRPQDAARETMVTHAQHAVAEHLYSSTYRIYFSSRDGENRPQVWSFDLDLNSPFQEQNTSRSPVISRSRGDFDEDGVYASSLLTTDSGKYMYYAGRKNNEDNSFEMTVAIASYQETTNSFIKNYDLPVMKAGPHDPWMVSTPWIYQVKDVYHMLYLSGLESGIDATGQKKTKYHLKHATSDDGLSWDRQGHIGIDFFHDGETNICRPSVLFEDGIYKAWYSYACLDNGIHYRLGYAESSDGRNWARKDHLAGMDITENSFDSDMICYPLVIKHENKKFMFYNGNHYGADGLALAVLD